MFAHSVARWKCICALVLIANAVQLRDASAADTFEPNDTIDTAAPIGVGVPLMSYVSTSGDVDYYQFTVPSWQQLRFDLTVPDGADYLMQVVSAGYADLGRHGADERLELTLGAGTYYIRVAGSFHEPGSHDSLNAYTLAFSVLAGDVFEPNNTFATPAALPLGVERSAFLFTSNDVDYYRIVTPAAGYLRITLDVPDTGQGHLSLFDSNERFLARQPIAIGVDQPGLDLEIVTAVPAGTYILLVHGTFDWYSQTEPYAVRADSGYFTDWYNRTTGASKHGPSLRGRCPARFIRTTMRTGIDSACRQRARSAWCSRCRRRWTSDWRSPGPDSTAWPPM